MVAFTKAETWLHIDPEFLVDNHSAINYQAVLECAFASAGGVCVNDKLMGDGYPLRSKAPDADDVCSFW